MLVQLLIVNGLDTQDLTTEDINTLPYLIKAELATQQLDLRSASDMYKTDGTYNVPDTNKLDSDEICGTVHLKRINSKDTSKSTILSYVDYTTFKGYANDQSKALNYFSFNDSGDLVIYTWNYIEITHKTSGTQPEHVTVEANSKNYYLEEITVDYQSLINKYTLPFEVLTALLINSEDVDFTKAVANLGMESNIEVGIMEEYSETTTVDTIKYNETVRYYKYLTGTIEACGKIQKDYDGSLINKLSEGDGSDVECEHSGKHGKDFTEKKENFTSTTPTFTVTQTTLSKTNTYKYGIIKADTWFLKIEKEYSSEKKTTTNDTDGSYKDKYKYSKDSTTKTGDNIDIDEVKNIISQINGQIQIPIVTNIGELSLQVNSANKIKSIKTPGGTTEVNANYKEMMR